METLSRRDSTQGEIMKKTLTALTLAGLLAVGATAYAQDTTPQSTEDACFAVNGNLDDSGKCIVNASLTIKIDYPLELQSDPAIGNLAETWIRTQKAQFLSDFTTGGSPSPAPWEMDISYGVTEGGNNLKSLKLQEYVFTGGAHGGNVIQTYTIDGSGKLLQLTDLFNPGADVLGTLQTIARDSVRTQLGADGTDEDWLTQGTADLEAFHNWIVDGDTLKITFDQYQVGPYAIGNIEVDIPFSQLGSNLNTVLTGSSSGNG
jgi:hypothetical protein